MLGASTGSAGLEELPHAATTTTHNASLLITQASSSRDEHRHEFGGEDKCVSLESASRASERTCRSFAAVEGAELPLAECPTLRAHDRVLRLPLLGEVLPQDAIALLLVEVN